MDPVYKETEKSIKDVGRKLMTTDPNLPEILVLSRMIYLELNERKPQDIPPTPLETQTKAFARIERTFGTAAAIKGLSQPGSLLIPPGENYFLQTADSARKAYPKELVRAELFGESKPVDDSGASKVRLAYYTERLQEIGIKITKQTLAEYEGLVGGYKVDSVTIDEKAIDDYRDLKLPYFPTLAEGELELEDGTFEFKRVALPDGKKAQVSLTSQNRPGPFAEIYHLGSISDVLIKTGLISKSFSPEGLARFGELDYRRVLTYLIGATSRFILQDYLKGDFFTESLYEISDYLRTFTSDPNAYFIENTRSRSFVDCWSGRGDPIAAAIRYQIMKNPGFLDQVDVLGADAPSLIPAVNSFRQEIRYSKEDSQGAVFGGDDRVKNNTKEEIKEQRAETLFVITGPAKEVAKIEALEYPVPGYDYGNFEPVEPSGQTEDTVTIRIADQVQEPRGPNITYLPVPMNSSLANLQITSYPDSSKEPFIPDRGWHYKVEQSGQGFISVDNLYGPSSITYAVSIEENPQPELPAELQKLEPKAVRDIGRRLKEVGYTALAVSINRFLQKNKSMSLYDLADCIENSADYSFNEKETDFKYLDSLADFVSPSTGRLEYQCDGARALTAYIVRLYLANARLLERYKIIPTTLFLVDNSKMVADESNNATLTVSKAAHARVHVTDGMRTLAILDTTPAIPQSENQNLDVVSKDARSGLENTSGKSIKSDPDLTELHLALDLFSKNPGIRRVFAGISDMQMRYFGDTPLFQIPKLALDLVNAYESKPEGLVQRITELEKKFAEASASFMRFLNPDTTARDPRIKVFTDGQIRGALFGLLQEMRKLFN